MVVTPNYPDNYLDFRELRKLPHTAAGLERNFSEPSATRLPNFKGPTAAVFLSSALVASPDSIQLGV